jgi:hypothetical protein
MQTFPSFFSYDGNGTLNSVWDVMASGNYEADCQLGHHLAQEFLNYKNPGLLLQVAKAMPQPHTGIEVGFFTAISLAALD